MESTLIVKDVIAQREVYGQVGDKNVYSNRRLSGVDPVMIEGFRRMNLEPSNPSIAIHTVPDEEYDAITPEQMSDITQAFNTYDEDGTGSISVDELENILRSLGDCPDDEELQKMMKEADENGNGVLEFTEFICLMANHLRKNSTEETRIRNAFAVFDTEKRGYITVADFRDMMTTKGEAMTEEEAEEMILELDPAARGRIYCLDFIAAVAESEDDEDFEEV